MGAPADRPNTPEAMIASRAAVLRIKRGSKVLSDVPLGKAKLLIGGGKGSQLRLKNAGLADECVQLDTRTTPFSLESRLGPDQVLVNGWAARKAQVKPGDRIEFCGITLELLDPDGQSVAPAAPAAKAPDPDEAKRTAARARMEELEKSLDRVQAPPKPKPEPEPEPQAVPVASARPSPIGAVEEISLANAGDMPRTGFSRPPWLEFVGDGAAADARLYLLRNGVIAGRQGELKVQHASVSKKHAKFEISNGALFVEDLGSTNGTWVNRERITRKAINDGDTLHIGAVEFRIRIPDAARQEILSGGLGAREPTGPHAPARRDRLQPPTEAFRVAAGPPQVASARSAAVPLGPGGEFDGSLFEGNGAQASGDASAAGSDRAAPTVLKGRVPGGGGGLGVEAASELPLELDSPQRRRPIQAPTERDLPAARVRARLDEPSLDLDRPVQPQQTTNRNRMLDAGTERELPGDEIRARTRRNDAPTEQEVPAAPRVRPGAGANGRRNDAATEQDMPAARGASPGAEASPNGARREAERRASADYGLPPIPPARARMLDGATEQDVGQVTTRGNADAWSRDNGHGRGNGNGHGRGNGNGHANGADSLELSEASGDLDLATPDPVAPARSPVVATRVAAVPAFDATIDRAPQRVDTAPAPSRGGAGRLFAFTAMFAIVGALAGGAWLGWPQIQPKLAGLRGGSQPTELVDHGIAHADSHGAATPGATPIAVVAHGHEPERDRGNTRVATAATPVATPKDDLFDAQATPVSTLRPGQQLFADADTHDLRDDGRLNSDLANLEQNTGTHDLRSERTIGAGELKSIFLDGGGEAVVRRAHDDNWEVAPGEADSQDASDRKFGASQLDPSRVNAIIRSHFGDVKNCLVGGHFSGGKARVVVDFTIQPSGRADNVRIASSDVRGAGFDSCVVGVVRGIHFPRPKSQSVVVEFPFVFFYQ